jgi:hypothetical protein
LSIGDADGADGADDVDDADGADGAGFDADGVADFDADDADGDDRADVHPERSNSPAATAARAKTIRATDAVLRVRYGGCSGRSGWPVLPARSVSFNRYSFSECLNHG